MKSSYRLWHSAHKCLGILSGLFIVFLGLTGSLLVFDHALDECLNPGLLTVANGSPESQKSLEEVLTTAALRFPDLQLTGIAKPRHPKAAQVVWFEQGPPDDRIGGEIYINPYTGEILGKRLWAGYLMSFIYELHYNFTLGDVGQKIVGVIGIAFLALLFFGVAIWWPGRRKWKTSLTIKSNAHPHRRNVDVHRVFGVYTLPILVTIAFSGVHLNLPEITDPVIELFSPLRDRPNAKGTGQRLLTADALKEYAQRVVPASTFSFAYFDDWQSGPWVFSFRDPNEPRRTSGFNRIKVDSSSGHVLESQLWQAASAGERFVAWQFPLHNGEAFGLAGRWIVCISGVVPAILFVTGILIWRKKRRGRASKVNSDGQ